MISQWLEERLALPDDFVLEPVDVIVAVGSDLSRDGLRASSQSTATARLSAQLYREGLGHNVLMVGGYRARTDGPTEAWAMVDLVLMEGQIEPGHLLMEEKSTTTVRNAQLALPILRWHGWKSALLVAQRWHARRVKATFKKQWAGTGISIAVVTAAAPYNGGSQRRFDSFWQFAAWDTAAFTVQKVTGQC